MTSEKFRARLMSRTSDQLEVSSETTDRLYHYYELLSHWNKKINLTSLELDPLTAEAVDRLFVEPLLASKYIGSSSPWIDIGSGGGSPAIPLKIVHPSSRLTMVESRSRKAAFLREVARRLDLDETVVICERFQAIAGNADLAGLAGLVTIRAVRIDFDVAHSCRQLLRRGGQLVVFGGDQLASPSGFAEQSVVELATGAKLSVFALV